MRVPTKIDVERHGSEGDRVSLELEPAASAPGPALKRMRGPSALGGGWRRFLALTWMVAVTEFRLTYFGSVLGYVWTLARPLMMFGVYYTVFTVIVNLGRHRSRTTRSS